MNVTARVRPSSVHVEVNLIGSDFHLGGVDFRGAFEILPLALGIFVHTFFPNFCIGRDIRFRSSADCVLLRKTGKRKRK